MRLEFPCPVDIARPSAVPPPSLAIDPETMLVNAARDGDAAAFQELFNRYGGRIFRLAHHLTQNREDAEDVVQDSLLKAFRHLDSFQGYSRFYTWLVRIAVNEALMKLRKRRPNEVPLDEPIETKDSRIPREIEDGSPTPEQRYAQQEVQRILAEAVGHLAPSLRIVFQLRDVEQLSSQETAQILGLSIPAVKSRLLRARLRLRQTLIKYFPRNEDLGASGGALLCVSPAVHAVGLS